VSSDRREPADRASLHVAECRARKSTRELVCWLPRRGRAPRQCSQHCRVRHVGPRGGHRQRSAAGPCRQRRRHVWRRAAHDSDLVRGGRPYSGPASVRSTRCRASGPTASSTPTQGAPTRSSIQRQTWPRAPRRPACPALLWQPCRGRPRQALAGPAPPRRQLWHLEAAHLQGIRAVSRPARLGRHELALPPSSSRSTGPRA